MKAAQIPTGQNERKADGATKAPKYSVESLKRRRQQQRENKKKKKLIEVERTIDYSRDWMQLKEKFHALLFPVVQRELFEHYSDYLYSMKKNFSNYPDWQPRMWKVLKNKHAFLSHKVWSSDVLTMVEPLVRGNSERYLSILLKFHVDLLQSNNFVYDTLSKLISQPDFYDRVYESVKTARPLSVTALEPYDAADEMLVNANALAKAQFPPANIVQQTIVPVLSPVCVDVPKPAMGDMECNSDPLNSPSRNEEIITDDIHTDDDDDDTDAALLPVIESYNANYSHRLLGAKTVRISLNDRLYNVPCGLPTAQTPKRSTLT